MFNLSKKPLKLHFGTQCKINDDEWVIDIKNTLLLHVNPDALGNVSDIQKVVLRKYFDIPWVDASLSNFIIEGKEVTYFNETDFISDFNKSTIEMTQKIKTVLKKMSTPILKFEEGRLKLESPVSKNWKFYLSDVLYTELMLHTDSWYKNSAKVKSKTLKIEAISLKSDNLIHDDQSGVHNELALVPMNNEGWFYPKSIRYIPMSINYVTWVKMHLTNTENLPLTLQNSQFAVILHFIKKERE